MLAVFDNSDESSKGEHGAEALVFDEVEMIRV